MEDFIVRTGKLFSVGEYADKDFTFDREDMERAVSSFAPVEVDLEHVPTVLQGKLGFVQRIWADEDGESLMGEVHLPGWLDPLLQDGERKVSATWDRATKTLRGLALVRNPRVSDAALMAAFTAGQEPVKTEAHLAAHPPKARSIYMGIMDWLSGKAKEDGVDITEDQIKAEFADLPSSKIDELQKALEARDAKFAVLEEANQRAEAERARLETESRHAAAATFATDHVTAHRVPPASSEALTALYEAITAPTVSFGEGVDATALLAAFVDSLPDLTAFTKESVDTSRALGLLPEGSGTKETINAARIKELAEKTPLGRDALAHASA